MERIMPFEFLCLVFPTIIFIALSLDEAWRYRLHTQKRKHQCKQSCQHQAVTYERTLDESHGFITVTLQGHCTDCGDEWLEKVTDTAERFYHLVE
jgi:hypothetical protein